MDDSCAVDFEETVWALTLYVEDMGWEAVDWLGDLPKAD